MRQTTEQRNVVENARNEKYIDFRKLMKNADVESNFKLSFHRHAAPKRHNYMEVRENVRMKAFLKNMEFITKAKYTLNLPH